MRFRNCRHSTSRLGWIIMTFFLAVVSTLVKGAAESSLPYGSAAQIIEETPKAAVVIHSACDKILKGDFASAQEIVGKSAVSDGKGLRQLRKIIDEYMALKARRNASRNSAYREQIEELEKLHQKGLLEDVNDISNVLSVIIKALEYADEQQKQVILRMHFVKQAIQKAKAKAAELESRGRWLDAYRGCYSKLEQIYKGDKAYSDYAEQLIQKADVLASLQDSPCETCEERYAGIKKQMFINAVDVLNSGYVNIVDYRRMAIKAVSRCQLLGEVISNSNLDKKYEVKNAQLVAWSMSLSAILHEVNELSTDINKDRFIEVFEQVLSLNECHRTRIGLPQTLLIAQFAEGAWAALDPYTVTYWPSQVQDFEKAITNQFSGIGIRFSKEEGILKVVSVLPNTPAYHSGLQVGDEIKAVDDVETKYTSSDCAAKRITGPEGTKVTLTITRPVEDTTCDITINRSKITVPSVHGCRRAQSGKWIYMIDNCNKIGYVRISSFNSRTAYDFEEALSQLEAMGLKGLIFDLRSNPGGLLDSAIEIADKFIKEGLIVRTQPRFGIATYASAHKGKTHPNYPLVVLIDRFTASASEIVAGALQDPKYNRATLVGERTYGKGSVQSIMSRLDGAARLKYTAAYYHLPSGQRVESRDTIRKLDTENWGILPDVNVKLRRDELRRIAEVQKANEFLVKVSRNNAPGRVTQYSSQEMIDTDPQLAIGLLVLKSKMIKSGYRLSLN